MKITVAKIFCFLTVLLLSSNVLFSSVLPQGAIRFKKQDKESGIEEIKLSVSSSNLFLSFLAEKDPFEEFEFIKDFPYYHSSRELNLANSNDPHKEHTIYIFSSLKVPLWLWVRHIII